ncbi:hypothetical protein KHC17_24740 (plasmid) [Agrobacterium salinitolerans]|uniref:hypothetical protein n=1 Tax=Agrobacterium salinitolerans TaxID=1183413 RepID=UPI001C21EEA2|nr:hypothetical protein [Agrobacterium salinitolerans]QXC52465.1 hypothetical protein KHC17_24740 [Agrobacterium salinitolerans]
MAVNMNRWAVRYFQIKELCPKPSEPFLSLGQDLRIAFACYVTKCHLDASLDRERMSVFFAKASPFIFCERGKPANAKGADWLNAVVKDEMRRLMVVSIKDKGRRDAMLMYEAYASEYHSIANMFRCGRYFASKIGKITHHWSTSLSGQLSSTSEGRRCEERRFQGGFQK